VPTSFWYLKF